MLERLDAAPNRALGALGRLELVAEACGSAMCSPAWSLSHTSLGSGTLSTVRVVDRRAGGAISFDVEGETYDLDNFPLTRRILDDGGAFVIVAEDFEADAAARRLLESWSMTAVLAAAAPGHGDGWLIELYADEGTMDLHGALPCVRLLVAEAVRKAAPAPDTVARARLHLA